MSQTVRDFQPTNRAHQRSTTVAASSGRTAKHMVDGATRGRNQDFEQNSITHLSSFRKKQCRENSAHPSHIQGRASFSLYFCLVGCLLIFRYLPVSKLRAPSLTCGKFLSRTRQRSDALPVFVLHVSAVALKLSAFRLSNAKISAQINHTTEATRLSGHPM